MRAHSLLSFVRGNALTLRYKRIKEIRFVSNCEGVDGPDLQIENEILKYNF